jgi:hypothetical protein
MDRTKRLVASRQWDASAPQCLQLWRWIPEPSFVGNAGRGSGRIHEYSNARFRRSNSMAPSGISSRGQVTVQLTSAARGG